MWFEPEWSPAGGRDDGAPVRVRVYAHDRTARQAAVEHAVGSDDHILGIGSRQWDQMRLREGAGRGRQRRSGRNVTPRRVERRLAEHDQKSNLGRGAHRPSQRLTRHAG